MIADAFVCLSHMSHAALHGSFLPPCLAGVMKIVLRLPSAGRSLVACICRGRGCVFASAFLVETFIAARYSLLTTYPLLKILHKPQRTVLRVCFCIAESTRLV